MTSQYIARRKAACRNSTRACTDAQLRQTVRVCRDFLREFGGPEYAILAAMARVEMVRRGPTQRLP